MKAGILFAALALIGCTQTENTFEVMAPEPATAELQLCGKTTNLERSGDKLITSRVITCEGAGEIIVRLPDQAPVICPVGYVTSGSEISFKYEIDGDQCR